MRKIVVAAFIFGLLLSSSAFAADLKIGVVNFEAVMSQSEHGKKAREQMERKVKSMEDALSKDQKELEKFQEEISKQGMALSQEAQKGKFQEYREKAMAFEKKSRTMQQDLMKSEQDIFKPMLDTLVKVTQDYAKSKGFTMIISAKQTVVYADPAFDLTGAILQEFNKSYKGK